jgi:hypothetical protein
LGSLPGSLSTRLRQAHRKADDREAKAQASVGAEDTPPAPSPDPTAVLEQLHAIVARLRQRGLFVEIREQSGAWVLVISPPDQQQLAFELGANALSQMGVPLLDEDSPSEPPLLGEASDSAPGG